MVLAPRKRFDQCFDVNEEKGSILLDDDKIFDHCFDESEEEENENSSLDEEQNSDECLDENTSEKNTSCTSDEDENPSKCAHEVLNFKIAASINKIVADFERRCLGDTPDQNGCENLMNVEIALSILELVKQHTSNRRVLSLFLSFSRLLIRIRKWRIVRACAMLYRLSLGVVVGPGCRWIDEHGGWEVVFGHIWIKIWGTVIMTLVFLIIGVCMVFVKNHW